MSARDDILGTMRRSLGVTGAEETRRRVVDERLARPPRGIVPARGQVDGRERVALFKTMAESVHATVTEVASSADIPAEVARYLRESNLPATLRMGADPRLAGLPWDKTLQDVTTGASDGHDLNGLSHAFGGVAETGTLILLSGPDNPTTINFLPDTHIVVLSGAEIVGDYETAWERLRGALGKGAMPRLVNMITGPSRSGDIEQKLLLGAHGPRRLHIVVVAAP
jgi:L-lactate dehydrogenase complex protein LldG